MQTSGKVNSFLPKSLTDMTKDPGNSLARTVEALVPTEEMKKREGSSLFCFINIKMIKEGKRRKKEERERRIT